MKVILLCALTFLTLAGKISTAAAGTAETCQPYRGPVQKVPFQLSGELAQNILVALRDAGVRPVRYEKRVPIFKIEHVACRSRFINRYYNSTCVMEVRTKKGIVQYKVMDVEGSREKSYPIEKAFESAGAVKIYDTQFEYRWEIDIVGLDGILAPNWNHTSVQFVNEIRTGHNLPFNSNTDSRVCY